MLCKRFFDARRGLALVLLAALTACAGQRIMICEQAQARVVLMDTDADWNDPEALLWQWQASDSPAIAPDQRAWFNHPTDAKPVFGGDFALITASGGGVALVRLEDKATIFHAFVGGNPHSAEILPDGNLVTVSSTGSSLKLWSLVRQAEPLQSVTLVDAHGVCWDPERQLLWAIGHDDLVSFRYLEDGAEPALVEYSRHPLPNPGGHDLQRTASGDSLVLTTQHGVWTFNPTDGGFCAYPGIEDQADVKSISEPMHQKGARSPTLLVRAEQEWWSDSVYMVGSDGRFTIPNSRIYKARWWFQRQRQAIGRPGFQISIGFGGLLGVDPE